MSLPVPLTVSVADRHITKQAVALAFRKEAVGGVQSITLNLDAPLASYAVSPFDTVKVMDARTAEVIAEGRISDPGRAASADGQKWSIVALGPANHATDRVVPLIYVDQSVTDGWRQVDRTVKGASYSQSTKPGSTSDTAAECIVFQFPQGLTVAANDDITARYERVREADMKIGGFGFDVDGGSNDANYQAKVWMRTDGAGGAAAYSANLSTATSSQNLVAVTDFSNGRNTIDLKLNYSGAGGTVANDNKWVSFGIFIIRAMLRDATGADRTTGYGTQYALAHEIVNDLLGRLLSEYDGAGATVASTGTYQIDSLAYPDGVSAREVMDDLMLLEPGFYWTTGPNVTGNGYSFEWKAWPTTVRYEATLEDGGDFPVTATELYNQVMVRWRDKRGRTRTTRRTGTCPLLDAAGLTRTAFIDVGDELASSTGAARVGDSFLAAHQYPANAGTLNVARPIRDLSTGRMVAPHEIEPGELIRVRGVESYPDALNASSNDGQTVFRIWAMTYTSDANTAQLELDTYPRTTWAALAKLQRARPRKR